MIPLGEEKAVGEVVSVNTADSILVVNEAAEETAQPEQVVFAWNNNTQIKKGDADLTASDLKAGDQVSLEYMMDADGNNVVKTIWVK